MATIFEETFDATGYDLSWTENKGGASSTLDEDSSLPSGPPTGFGGQCLHIINNAYYNCNTTYTMSADKSVLYLRFYAYFSSLPSAGEYSEILRISTEAGGFISFLRLLGSTIHFRIIDDVVDTYDVATDTSYLIELYINDTTNEWEWKINGSSQGSGTLSSGLMRKITFGTTDSYSGVMNVYIDNVKVDDSTWVGAWSPSATVKPWHYYAQQ